MAAEHDKTMAYPWAVIKKAHAAGLMNSASFSRRFSANSTKTASTAHIPEAFGGAGLDLMSGALISEELAFGCTGIQTAMEANGVSWT